jgi:class 3 adenylate cyclase
MAYTYPRKLAKTFTIEFWVRGQTVRENYATGLSVAHPSDDNLFSMGNTIYVLAVEMFKAPRCGGYKWCHQAVTVDASAYPSVVVKYYLDGELHTEVTKELTVGSPASRLEDETSCLSFGAEQDAVLGGWDPSQILSGQLDEIRMWNRVRTAAEIKDNYRLKVGPTTANLMMYYNFDDASATDTWFVDAVDATNAAKRMYVGDHSDPLKTPSTSAPPSQPVPAYVISNAPVCATQGDARIRSLPGAAQQIDIASLYCGATGTATVTVTSVHSGGAVTQGGSNVLGTALDAAKSLEYTAPSGAIPADARFDFTVTDSGGTATGAVLVLPNSAPTISSELALLGTEDTPLTSWIPVTDAENDAVWIQVVEAATSGIVHMDGAANRMVFFEALPNAFGKNISVASVRAYDQWGAQSDLGKLVFSLKPAQDAPYMVMNTTYTLYRGQQVQIPFEIVNVDGKDSFAILSDWPTEEQGLIKAKDDSREWDINSCSVSSQLQWASNFSGYSTAYGANPMDSYGIGQIIGEPQTQFFGDSRFAWSPLTINGNCQNRATPEEADSHFYTEYMEVVFKTPMYLTDVVIRENYGSGRAVRILVPSDRDASKWKPIFHRYLPDIPSQGEETKYGIYSPDVCEVVWPVDRIRIEADTCHRVGWYEIDAVQMRGGVVAPINILNTTAQLHYITAPRFTGNVTFALTATDCYGSFAATSEPRNINIQVLEPPFTRTFTAKEGWVPVDVSQTTPAYTGSRASNVQVLELPERGNLRHNGQEVKTIRTDLSSTDATFEYQGWKCDPSEKDSFVVQLSPDAVVLVVVDGCEPTSPVGLILGIVLPVVLVLLVILAVAFYLLRPKGRDNRYAPKDPTKKVCVLFTDIQASTTLWGEIPEQMSEALDVHHAVIRKLIKKYKCYEVKTVGDCFMVATADPCNAVRLALGIQDALYDYDWPDDAIDEVYRTQTEDQSYLPDYFRKWRGLRVRVGLHYGQANIILDEVTKGYDYYGTVVNAASRIESVAHGAQVVVSSDVYEAISASTAALGYEFTSKDLGTQQLRGLPSAMDLVQLTPARFSERTFPPLRLEKAGDVEDDDGDDVESISSGGTSVRGVSWPRAMEREVVIHPIVRNGTMSVEEGIALAYNTYYSIHALLCLTKGDARKKALKEYCKQWHVPLESNETKVMCKIAMKIINSVVTLQNQNDTGRPGTSRSLAGKIAPAANLQQKK